MVQAHWSQAIHWAQLSHRWFIKHVLKSSLRSSLFNTAPLISFARGRFSARGETSNCIFWIEGYREAAIDLLIWQWTIFSKSHQSIQIPDFKPKNFWYLLWVQALVKPWLLSNLNADIYYFSYLKIPKCACSVFQVLWTGSSLYLRAASSCFQSACAPCVLQEKCECIDLFGFNNR